MKTPKLIPTLILTTLCAFAAARSMAQADEDPLKEKRIAVQRQNKKLVEATADAQNEIERNVNEVERHIQYAQAQAGGQGGQMFRRAFGASYVNSTDAPLIVATKPIDSAALAELREDLTVMGKLVNDSLADNREDAGVHRAMGIVVNWLPGNAATENLYIEGHGVILQATVRFPLAPPKKEEAAKSAETPKNSAWESARRELFGGENEETEVLFPPERREEYAADRVESLKKNVLKALASASNFRRLDGDETVTAVVRSRAGSRSQLVVFKSSHDGHGKTQTSSNETVSTMTVRIKKSDADALASGKITEDEFRKRAKVAIY